MVRGRSNSDRGFGSTSKPARGWRLDVNTLYRVADGITPRPQKERGIVSPAHSRAAYERALTLMQQEPERRFIERRLEELDD